MRVKLSRLSAEASSLRSARIRTLLSTFVTLMCSLKKSISTSSSSLILSIVSSLM
uniref:Uncharacterized protein n=1 Tax=Arundo donax TaxID=35708 RepID=A0A0A9CJC6_ARUDO